LKLALTLHQFILKNQESSAHGIFSCVMEDVALACRMIAAKLRYGYISGDMGKDGSTNASGDSQVSIDILANDIFVELSKNNGNIRAIASEELDEIHYFDNAKDGKYILVIDPLDGSSNLEVNGPVASIFSICLVPDKETISEEDIFESARNPVASGVCLYGLSTFFSYTTGNGVHGFTQDLESGTFLYTHPFMTVKPTAREVAINYANKHFWNEPITRYVEDCFRGESGPRKRYFNTRWYASAAAEMNRILIRGGVFIYPSCSNGKPNGVLRKLYEAWPMAFMIEAAGGKATNGIDRILDVPATSLHEKTPFVMGSPEEVDLIRDYHLEK